MRKVILTIWFLGLIFGSLALASVCQAEPVKIGFTGSVDGINDSYNLLQGAVQHGTPISGFYVYDLSMSPSFPASPTVADYWHYQSPYGIWITVGDIQFKTDLNNVRFLIEIINNYEGFQEDHYLIRSYNNLLFNNDVYIEGLSWQLDDYSGAAISNTTLPVFPPELSAWQFNNLMVSGGRGGTPPCFDETFQINGHINSDWLVPEPTMLLLFGLGILLIGKKG
jgi:hypothetical protein